MQTSNFGGTFDQLFLWIFFMNFSHKMSLYFFFTMVQKLKIDQKLKSRCPALIFPWLTYDVSFFEFYQIFLSF